MNALEQLKALPAKWQQQGPEIGPSVGHLARAECARQLTTALQALRDEESRMTPALEQINMADISNLTLAQVDAVLTRFGRQLVTPAPQPVTLEWSPTLCDSKHVSYADAEKAVAALNAQRAPGEPEWRIPGRMELESILDLTRHDPAVDTTRFPDTKSGWYWTSTPCAWSPDYVWIVSFGRGDASYDPRRANDDAFVRAVRDVPAGQ